MPVLGVVLAALAALAPVIGNGFVEFDDRLALLGNPHFRGLGWENLRWMLTHFWGVHYFPLTWLSFALDYSLWGLDPRGYHLTSLLLHALNAALVFRLCRAFALPEPPAAFGALFFALHPLRVESVAWAVQRSDVLSTAFYLGAALAYLKGRRAAALALFLAGLASKATGLGLPLVLVVLDVWPLGRLPGDPRRWSGSAWRPIWREKLPFFGLSLAWGLLGLLAHQPGTAATLSQAPWSLRLAQAAWAPGFYLAKTLLPSRLVPLCEPPTPLAPWVALSAATALLLAVLLLRLRRRAPGAAAAGACYLALLLPALGLFKFGPHFAADRYTYLACLPWAVLAGAGLERLLPGAPRAAALAAALWLAALGRAAFVQAGAWRDDLTLWGRAVAAAPRNHHARNYLGRALERAGRLKEAGGQFRRAVELAPDHAPARNNLGNALLREGKVDEAISQYREALRLEPGQPVAERNLADALRLQAMRSRK